MELALQCLQWESCLIDIDGIIVFATNFDQHIERVRQVLERIKIAGLKLRPEKCQILQLKVVFLGHIASGEGVSPNPTTIAKIAEWQLPTTAK